MKNIILLVVLLYGLKSYCQPKNVYVEYGVELQMEKDFMEDASFRKTFEIAMNNDSKFSFGLIIAKDGAKFSENKGMASTTNMESIVLDFAGYSGEVYYIKDSVYTNYPILGKDIYCRRPNRQDWVLTTETKRIDKFLCYKATNVNKVTYGEKVFNHPVTAWYCPKLPYSYGPNGYGNLPGLILELQVRNVVYGAKSIDLHSALDFKTDFLKNSKIISEAELNRLFNKWEEDEFGGQ